jgi:hypothetical protein
MEYQWYNSCNAPIQFTINQCRGSVGHISLGAWQADVAFVWSPCVEQVRSACFDVDIYSHRCKLIY